MTDKTKDANNAAADKEQNAGGDDNAKAKKDDVAPPADGADSKAKGGEGSAGDEGAAADDGSALKIYKPEGLDDHLVGDTDQKTIDNLLKRNKGLRDELANKKGLPEKFEDYKIEFSKEDEEKYLTKNADGVDPVFELMRKVGYEEGVSPAATQSFFKRFAEEVFNQAEAAEKAFGEGDGDDNGIRADLDFKGYGGADKAKPVQEAAHAWLDGLKNQGVIDDVDAYELKLLSYHGGGLRALEKLRVMSGEKPIPVNMDGGGGSGDLTEAKLHSLMKDPRYWKTKDPAFIAEVTAGFKKLYGDEAA